MIFKSLGKHWRAVIIIVLLLLVQAYCDLSLPSYTSDIVDVGIQQKGLEHSAMETIRQETMENICLFLTEEEKDIVLSHYTLSSAIYEIDTNDEEELEELDDIMSMPMVMLLQIEKSNEYNIDTLRQSINSGILRREDVMSMGEKMLEQYGSMSDSIIKQGALQFVQSEYEAQGQDVNDIQHSYLMRTGAKMLLLSLIMVIVAIASGFFSARVGAKIGMDLREGVFNKVVSFTNTEMDKFSTASLITRSTNDIQQVQMVCVVMLRMVAYAPILGIGGILKVIHTDTGMGWVIAVAVAAILAVVAVLMAVAMPKFKMMQKLVDRMNLVSREILTGLSVIRAFGREDFEEERFDVANRELMGTQLFTNRVMTFMMPLMMLIMNGISVLIVWVGSNGIDAGSMQVGDMIAFITYTMQIVMSFLMLTMISVMLPRAGVAADRIEEVLNTEVTVKDVENADINDKKADFKGKVTFEDVSFRYEGADEDAIEHISFTAEPGRTTAIIGSTGCGKSTLVHLIPRFYDVSSGKITVDGIDIREMSQKKLRSLIGFVPQKGVLFSGDIASNIKFGGDGITDAMMQEAAEIAQATEFIEEKKDGYKSAIAQGGSNVSGGQKQRLSIARAIAKNPKIFIFDDSFSALDYKTDMKLRKRLNEKVSSAAVIIVAQRISTILNADQIIVLDDGRIAGKGTHEQLMESCETYQEIARSQLSEAELSRGGVH